MLHRLRLDTYLGSYWHIRSRWMDFQIFNNLFQLIHHPLIHPIWYHIYIACLKLYNLFHLYLRICYLLQSQSYFWISCKLYLKELTILIVVQFIPIKTKQSYLWLKYSTQDHQHHMVIKIAFHLSLHFLTLLFSNMPATKLLSLTVKMLKLHVILHYLLNLNQFCNLFP